MSKNLTITFPTPDPLVLIGGGDVMVHAAQMAKSFGLRVAVVLAPRHAEEMLPLGRTTTRAALEQADIITLPIDDINAASDLLESEWVGPNAVALCFGPAWVFNEAVRRAFGGGMINYNPIPVPRYLGGAHYTWQILNGDRSGGVIMQLITGQLDRGPIIEARYFDIPSDARTPEDYFSAYSANGSRLVDDVVRGLIERQAFETVPYSTVNERRLYLPRLLTSHNGWIDWSWNGEEIERFCCAFDKPYRGAATLLEGEEIRLRSAKLEKGEDFHPFLSGLVVRRIGEQTWVAVRGGMLRIDNVSDSNDQNAIRRLREGQRLVTPPDNLYDALVYRPRLTGKVSL